MTWREYKKAVQRNDRDVGTWADLSALNYDQIVYGPGEGKSDPIYFGRAFSHPPQFSYSAKLDPEEFSDISVSEVKGIEYPYKDFANSQAQYTSAVHCHPITAQYSHGDAGPYVVPIQSGLAGDMILLWVANHSAVPSSAGFIELQTVTAGTGITTILGKISDGTETSATVTNGNGVIHSQRILKGRYPTELPLELGDIVFNSNSGTTTFPGLTFPDLSGTKSYWVWNMFAFEGTGYRQISFGAWRTQVRVEGYSPGDTYSYITQSGTPRSRPTSSSQNYPANSSTINVNNSVDGSTIDTASQRWMVVGVQIAEGPVPWTNDPAWLYGWDSVPSKKRNKYAGWNQSRGWLRDPSFEVQGNLLGGHYAACVPSVCSNNLSAKGVNLVKDPGFETFAPSPWGRIPYYSETTDAINNGWGIAGSPEWWYYDTASSIIPPDSGDHHARVVSGGIPTGTLMPVEDIYCGAVGDPGSFSKSGLYSAVVSPGDTVTWSFRGAWTAVISNPEWKVSFTYRDENYQTFGASFYTPANVSAGPTDTFQTFTFQHVAPASAYFLQVETQGIFNGDGGVMYIDNGSLVIT